VIRGIFVLVIASCLFVSGADLITVVSADPEENVLLEVSCDGPRSLEMSKDLLEWKPVVSYLPQLDRFRLEAPQYSRTVTYFRLVDISSDPRVFQTSDQIAVISGKRFGSFVFHVSFDEGGTGLLNNSHVNAASNHSYEVIDQDPGVVSVRLNLADGSRNALTLVFADQPAEDGIGEASTVSFSLMHRYGDFYSYPYTPHGNPDTDDHPSLDGLL
jgi:hypothetical protein